MHLLKTKKLISFDAQIQAIHRTAQKLPDPRQAASITYTVTDALSTNASWSFL